MREQLRETIDRLFRDAPQTAKTAEIKEEILQNLLDKYDDLLREGRDEQSAYHAAISGIGDVGTLIAELRREAGDTPAYPTPTAEPAASPTPPAPGAPDTAAESTRPRLFSFTLPALVPALARTLGAALLLLSPLIPLYWHEDEEEAFLLVLLCSLALLTVGLLLREKGRRRSLPKAFFPLSAAAWALVVLAVVILCLARGRWLPALFLFPLGISLSLAILALLDLKERKEFPMKKTSAIARLGIWMLTAVLLTVGAFATPAAKADRDEDRSGVGYTAGSATVDAQEVSELEIDWVSGSVRVEAGSEDTVVFEESMASGAVAAEDALQWRLNRGTLQIEFCTDTIKRESILAEDYAAKDLVVRVPASLLNKLEIDLVNGDIDVADLTVGDLELDAVSGAVAARSISAREASVSTTSANATLENVTATSLDAETTSGQLTLDGSFSEVDLETVSGDITLVCQTAPRQVESESLSGNVRLTLPEGTGFSVSLETSTGSLLINGSRSANLRATEGDQAVRCEFESMSGSVELNNQGSAL